MIAALDTLFDEPALRGLSPAAREPVTALLEAMLGRVIALARPDFSVEIGAFEAGFSRRMRAALPGAAVIAYEANPRVFDRFAQGARAAGVDYRHAALSDRDGAILFNVMEAVAGRDMPEVNRLGSIRPMALENSRSVTVEVRTARLDGEMADVPGSQGCLWVDVEGAAAEVLRGATETLARTEILYCEVESGAVWQGQALAVDVIALAEAAGFALVARDCQKAFQKNCLFLRPALAARAEIVAELAAFSESAVRVFNSAAESFRTAKTARPV